METPESLGARLEALLRVFEQLRKKHQELEIELKSHLEKAQTVEEYESERVKEVKRDIEKLWEKLDNLASKQEIREINAKLEQTVTMKSVTLLITILGLFFTALAFIFNYVMGIVKNAGGVVE